MQANRRRHRLTTLAAAAAATTAAVMLAAGPAQAAVLPQTTCSLDVATNTRTCELYAQTGTVELPLTASATLSLGGAVANDEVLYTAVATGPAGNAVTVSYVNAGASSALLVNVTGSAVDVQLATDAGGAPISTAAEIAAAVSSDAAANALLTATLPSGSDGSGIPVATAPRHLTGGSMTLPVWTFGTAAGDHPTTLGGPTLVAVAGETLRIVVHNDLPGERLAVTVPQQPGAPAASKAATGDTFTLVIPGLTAGTSIYEAGASTGMPAGEDDVEQQVAMGLYGALVVRPSSGGSPDTGSAYGEAAGAFDDEAVLLLGEIDPQLNRSANPSSFNMTFFQPSFHLINGRTYDGVSPLSTEPIAAAPGDAVLLRYVNAGVFDHSMGILGLHQRIVGQSGVAGDPREAVAETVPPGQTMDAIVDIPTGADGTNYVLSDQGQRLDNEGAGWSTSGNQPIAMGGMLTFISATSSGTAAACYGPTTTDVHVPDYGSGAADLPVTAAFQPCDGHDVTAAELILDSEETGSTFPASVMPDGSGGWTLDTASIPASALAGLATGNHTVFVHAQGADEKWGSVSADTFFVDNSGPAITGVTLKPAVTKGLAGSTVLVTLTADDTATGNQNVMSGQAFIDGTNSIALQYQLAGQQPAPLVAMKGTFTLPSDLAEGDHAVTITATDGLGNVTSPAASFTLTVDRTGPVTSSVVVDPSPNNGTLDNAGQPGNVFVDAQVDDVPAGVARVEGFIDTPGANGSGFVFVPTDGTWGSASEAAHVPIPLGQIAALSEGLHHILVHGRDGAGNWGALTAGDLVIDRHAPTTSLAVQTPILPGANVTLAGTATDPVAAGVSSAIDGVEWYIGANPGAGNGRTDGVTITGNSVTVVVPISALTPGANNTVAVRALDAAGNWGPAQQLTFAVPPRPLFAYAFDSALAVNAADPFSATAWSGQVRGNRMAIDTAVKAAGASSLRVLVGPPGATAVLRTSWLVKRFTPAVSAFTGQFAFNPNRALFGAAGTTIFQGYAGNTGVFRLQVRQQGTATAPTYQVRAQYRPAFGGAWNTNAVWRSLPNPNGFTTLAVSWRNGGNGRLVLTVGTTTYSQNINGGGLALNSIQLGALNGVPTTAAGSVYFDSFSSQTP